MSIEVERLIATLEARVDKYEKALARSFQKSDENFGKIERRADKMTESIERSMLATGKKAISFGASIAAGFVGGFAAGGISQVISSIGQVASSVAAVGDEARRAGVDVESFQELKFVAEQNRVSVGALTDGLKELNLRADEFIVTGGGSAAEAFQRLGFTADELKLKLQNPSALFSEIIGKLGQLDQAAQIRIADEIFGGTGGEQFVQLIEQGERGISDTIRQARELGVVMSSDLVDKAAELDRQFNAVSTTVGSTLKGMIVGAAAALGDFLRLFDEASKRGPLSLQAAKLDPVALQADIDRARNIIGSDDTNSVAKERSQTYLDALLAQQRQLETMDSIGPGADWAELQGLRFPPKPIVPVQETEKSKASSAATEAERQAKAVQNLIAGLEFERQMIGLSALEQEKLTNLRRADVDASSAQGQQISQLTELLYTERTAAQQMEDIWQAVGDAGRTAFEGIVDAMADGKIEGEELADVLRNIASQVGSMLLNQGFGALFGGGSGGAGLLSALFGGKREGGGPVTAGKAYLVGEKRPELFVPNTAGTIVPRLPQGDVLSFPFAPSITVTDGTPEGIARLQQAMGKMQSEFEGRVKKIVRERGRKW